LGFHRLSLDRIILETLREEAKKLRVDWGKVLEADENGPGGRERYAHSGDFFRAMGQGAGNLDQPVPPGRRLAFSLMGKLGYKIYN